MRFRSAPIRVAALLVALATACGGRGAATPQSTADVDATEEEASEDGPEDATSGDSDETDVEDGAPGADPEASSEQEPAPEPPFADDARRSLRASEPPPSTLGLGFGVSQRGADLPWLVVLANPSDAPVRVAGDMRLLRLEIRPPGDPEAAKSQKKDELHVCELPDADRPKQVEEELSVDLAPGLLLAQQFDPRFYCDPDWLVPGAVVTPKFGWPLKTRVVWRQGKRVEEPVEQTDPFLAKPMEAADAPEPLKELTGEPFTLDQSYAPPPPPVADPDAPPPLMLEVQSPGTVRDPSTATLTILIKNPAPQGRHLFFRRELVTYEVIGPHATSTCSVYPDDRAPQRQAFDFIRAGGTMRVASRLAEMCSPAVFGPPGLYRIHARLDATESGEDYGIEAFVGVVTTREPALLRIRGGKPRPMWLLPITTVTR